MGSYLIAVGGTGNKILESAVYGACIDAFYTLENGRRVPLDRVRMLVVDVDAACGNTTRAKQASEHYERVRCAFDGLALERRGFHTELAVDRWSLNLSKRAASVAAMTQNHKDEQRLSRALFSKTEAELDYGEGFRGHPDLGVLFFADLLSGIAEAERTGQPDEMVRFLHEMQTDLDRGQDVRVMLVGSIFGGTGASGIPSISRYLRERFRAHSDRFMLGAVLMLPYYKVPPANVSEELEIVVKSSTFLDKARTALQYYGMEGVIRSSESDESGVYDALYLLGLPKEHFVTTRVYSTGSQSQENDAHMLEWLAMRCVARFLRTGFRGAQSGNMDCYYYQWHTRSFSWESFDDEADLYRTGYGGLLKAATAFFAECYPVLRAYIQSDTRSRGRTVNYCAAFFHGARRFSAADRAALEKDLDALYRLLAFYANWISQVLHTLPPALRTAQEPPVQALAECCDRLTDTYALIREASAERSESERERLESEYRSLTRERDAAARALGGGPYVSVLREALGRADSALAEHAQAQRGLAESDARAQAIRAAVRRLERKKEKLTADLAEALQNELSARVPEGEAPENDLLDAVLADALHELLCQYGLAAENRDHARIAALCAQLCGGMDKLIRQRVPDRVDMSKLSMALAGGPSRGKGAHAALASFWAALLGAALEEKNA